MGKIDYAMLLFVVNAGYSAEVVSTAKEAGARGGTIINAKHASSNDVVRFLGIAVREEKEIIAIVTSDEKKAGIMDTVNKEHGMQTPAQGISVSVPVDAIAGMKV